MFRFFIPRKKLPHWLQQPFYNLRDTFLLLRQFRGSVSAFLGVVVGGGILYYWLAQYAGEPRPASVPESVFFIVSMVFFQYQVEFPAAWYLDIFFFLMPIFGLVILSQGAADFGVLLFNRRARGEAWQVEVASTYTDHIVIIGLGHLGFRVARTLHQLGEDFVIIERADVDADLMPSVQEWNAPVIKGDAIKYETLKNAGVDRAHTVVIVTSDDAVNLQIAIHTRAVNPQIRTIVRLFDDDFTREVTLAFGLTAAYSASALAAPAFAAAAANVDLTNSVKLGNRALNMAHFTLKPKAVFVNQTVGEMEANYDLSVVLLKRDANAKLHPTDDTRLKAGDQITIFADNATLHKVNRLNK